nr:glucocorticoid-induced transcript 1 protein-like isoform X1 [Onthophagus taurus]
MSGQCRETATARAAAKTSLSSQKQGPLKATIPMSSVLKHPGHIRKGHSPQLSPTIWKPRTSSDSGLRSPGSTVYKEKSKTLGSVSGNGGSAIRRTASLDTIYLRGHWPRDSLYYSGFLLIDKATQTEDYDWTDTRKIHCIAENDDKLEKMIIKQRLQRSNNQQSCPGGRSGLSPSNSPVTADHTLTTSSQTNTSCMMPPPLRANPVNIPVKPLPKQAMRSSVEGLNQEIERLVLKSCKADLPYSDRGDDNKFCQATPEGHRAPLPVMCSVNTQTPSANDIMGSCHSLSPASRNSMSPLICGNMDLSSGGSVGSSPEHEGNKLGTSPRIFMARGPPDGCEKVPLRQQGDERRSLPLDHAPQPPCTFQLKPSLGSAFQLLQPSAQSDRHHHQEASAALVPSPQQPHIHHDLI